MADDEPPKSALQMLRGWGGKQSTHPTSHLTITQLPHYLCLQSQLTTPLTEHSFPPTILAALIFAQHARPFQALPMAFPPLLLLTSYLNVGGFKKDAAGMSAAWSGVYAVLALRRKQVRALFASLRAESEVFRVFLVLGGWETKEGRRMGTHSDDSTEVQKQVRHARHRARRDAGAVRGKRRRRRAGVRVWQEGGGAGRGRVELKRTKKTEGGVG